MKILALGALDAARLAARGKGLCWSRGQGRTCPFRRRLGRSGAWPLRRPRAKHPGRPQGCQRRACAGGVASRAGLHQGSPRPSALRAGRTDRARRARAGLAHRHARSSRSRSSFFRISISGRPATTSWDSSACPPRRGPQDRRSHFYFLFLFLFVGSARCRGSCGRIIASDSELATRQLPRSRCPDVAFGLLSHLSQLEHTAQMACRGHPAAGDERRSTF